jgi:SAM-dependent methyltransferase
MKTPACSDVADCVWLTGDEAGAMLAELADDDTPLHLLVSKLRGRLTAQQTHLLLEQVELRRRATAKFAHPERMFFTRLGLEQATDEWVAEYKARRFSRERAGPSSAPAEVADLCCGIGGDLSALARNIHVVGVDRDPKTAHFAAVNSSATVHSIEADQFDLNGISALHIDPDRRPTGRRTTSLEAMEPDLAAIEALIAQIHAVAVKLAPATRVPTAWADRCELEWISRDRECRQLVAWHGELAQFPGQHRATILPAASGLAAKTLTGLPNQSLPIAPKVGRYVFDVDAAVRAARLTGVLASQHALSALAKGPTYLTGPRPIDDPLLACFEVNDVFPFEPRILARRLAERAIGRLEIKKRSVDIDPEKLRRELKLRGDNAATLLVTRAGDSLVAILAQRSTLPSFSETRMRRFRNRR